MQLPSQIEFKDDTEIHIVIEQSDTIFTLTEEVYLDVTKTKETDLSKYQ